MILRLIVFILYAAKSTPVSLCKSVIITFKSASSFEIKSSSLFFVLGDFTNGCKANRANSSAISFGDKIKSIFPEAIAE